MPVGKCGGCGRITNSTTSNWWELKHWGKPTHCYAAFVDGKWVKGCAETTDSFIIKLIGKKKKGGHMAKRKRGRPKGPKNEPKNTTKPPKEKETQY